MNWVWLVPFAIGAYVLLRLARHIDSLEDRIAYLEQMTGYDRRRAVRDQNAPR